MKTNSVAFGLLISIAALPAGAAYAEGRWFAPAAIGYGLGGGWGGGIGLGYGGVGTAASVEGQAMADMVRSQGMYNAMTSSAMINVEQARGQYIENQKQWTELYLMRQRIRQEQRVQAEQDRRVRNARIQEARANRPPNEPPRLASMQLDPSTGKISWPSALRGDAFSALRSELDGLFETRAHTGTTSDLAEAVLSSVRNLQAELRKRIREIPTGDYLEARRFLDGLSREVQAPAG